MMSATTFCPASAQDFQRHVSKWITSFNIGVNNWPENRTSISYSPLSNTAVLRARYGTDVQIRKPRDIKHYVFHVPLKGAFICYVNGKEKVVTPGQAFMICPGMEIELVFPKDSETLVLRINEDFFLNNLFMLGGNMVSASQTAEGYSVDMRSNSGELLKQALSYLQAEAFSSVKLTQHTEFVNNLESTIICRIIAAMGIYNVARGTNIEFKDDARQLVCEATGYIEAHLRENISTTRLAQYCGVSYRTLQRAFVSVHGISPLGWLKQKRLHGARDELLRPVASEKTSVTEVATNWGFNDLGRFAAQYREHFGELPKETLRRAKKVSVFSEYKN